jgi:hypothetical protein
MRRMGCHLRENDGRGEDHAQGVNTTSGFL